MARVLNCRATLNMKHSYIKTLDSDWEPLEMNSIL